MNIIPSHNPDILESRKKKVFAFARLFGVMSLFTCIVIVANAFELKEGGNIPAFIFVMVFAAVFGILGTILVFGQTGFIFDRRRKKVVYWMGIFGMEKKEEHFLGNYDGVLIGKELRSTTTGTRIFNSLMLKGKTDDDNLGIYLYRDYDDALKYAQLLSDFLDMEIVDSTR